MSRDPSLSIRLVRSPACVDEAWPWDLLSSHLEAAGHRVETCSSASAPTAPAPDVIHCLGLSAASGLAVEDQSAPVIVTPCADDAGDRTAPTPLLTTSASVVRSSVERTRMHQLGIPWSRTWVLPAAVDVDTFTRLGPMARRTDRFRLVTEMGGPDDGIEDVITAVARLGDVELAVLAGETGSAGASSARETVLRAVAAEAGMSDRLVVATPSSPGERAWWLRSAHVAVAVPHTPGRSDFVAEAMACGVAVVASRVDALADLVIHGVTGFLVPTADPLSVARAVRVVLADDFSIESYGMAAADRALSRFAWPRVVHELVGVYGRVAAMDRGAGYEAEETTPDEREVPVLLGGSTRGV